jgi:hypothetical protein
MFLVILCISSLFKHPHHRIFMSMIRMILQHSEVRAILASGDFDRLPKILRARLVDPDYRAGFEAIYGPVSNTVLLVEKRTRPSLPATSKNQSEDCAYLGEAIKDADGRQAERNCPTCQGNVRVKVFACRHPGHAGDPTTTIKDCRTCGDYEAVATAGPD